MMFRLLPLALAALVLAAPAASAAGRGDPNDPLWPCVQRKVPELDLGAVWTGPAIDPKALDWRKDRKVADLVAYLVQRRVPLDEADKAVTGLAAEAGPRKAETLKLLFAGLFDRLNAERKEVMAGIDRFGRKQIAFAESLKQRNAELDKLRNDKTVDFAKIQAAADEVLWETRVFDERQKSLTYVCEVPVIIEQRLFHLGKTIAGALKQ